MALNVALLRDGMRPLFAAGGMPTSVSEAVDAWGRAYSQYARGAMAGATLPNGTFVVSRTDGTFLAALDASLRKMWMAVSWVGPGLIGTTTVVPPLQPSLMAKSATLIGSADSELALSLITEAIHTYTLSVTVTIVPTAGSPFIVTIT